MTASKYLLMVGIGCVTILLAGATLNWYVDPLNRFERLFDDPRVQDSRQAKINLINNFEPDCVYFGSSKGMALSAQKLTEASGCRFFNAAVTGMAPEEILQFIENYVPAAELVIIGFDFFMLNEWIEEYRPNSFPSAEARRRWTFRLHDKVEYIFSLSAFVSSLKWLLERPAYPQAYYDEDGSSIHPDPSTYTREYIVNRRAQFFESLDRYHYRYYQYSLHRSRDLVRLRDLLEERGIPYITYISPLNEQVIDLINRNGMESTFEKFLEAINDPFPATLDLSHGSFSEDSLYWPDDPYHFLPSTGDLIIDMLFLEDSPIVHGRSPAPSP